MGRTLHSISPYPSFLACCCLCQHLQSDAQANNWIHNHVDGGNMAFSGIRLHGLEWEAPRRFRFSQSLERDIDKSQLPGGLCSTPSPLKEQVGGPLSTKRKSRNMRIERPPLYSICGCVALDATLP
eukprot:scaffold5639_cov83-Cylindrotheca_fusiformis.AAC.1